ncbi:MAG: PadR family transcriptional regulator [Micrococcales bacterium]|nr:PadR family transcriptional regulator [Micrococcales bacterium]
MQPTEADLLIQLRKGVLEYCVLARLAREPSYGHQIAADLGRNGLFGSAGSLYPLLSRLRKQGWVASTWEESRLGAARRYYTLTPEGRASLTLFSSVWHQFSDAVHCELRQQP